VIVNSFSSQTTGRLAIAIGAVTLIGIVLIILFFAFGGFFGPLNDLSIAVEAILSAGLAWMLHPLFRSTSPQWSRFTLIAAWVGALIATIGSALVIFGVTGWFLAGLYSMFGYGLVGVWLLGLNYSARRHFSWPRRLVQFGLVIGITMTVGLLTGPGILGGVDAMDSAPWYVNVGQIGGLGWFILYPFWCIWLGRVLLSARLAAPTSD
jgi:hypothetical protein